jgi:hypothetical protein
MPDAPSPVIPNIAALAQERLRQSAYLALHDVACFYAHGVLTLHGCLPSHHLKQMAQVVVGEMAGIEQIENLIGVVSWEQRRHCSAFHCPRLPPTSVNSAELPSPGMPEVPILPQPPSP